MERYDVVIIGAGALGCALAYELKSEHWMKDLSVAVVEKNSRSGMGVSSKASGVLHPGIHHHPKSLKAVLAQTGSRRAYQFATDNGVPVVRDGSHRHGMVIAIASADLKHGLWKESSLLWRLWRNGKKQELHFSTLTSYGIKKLEPAIHAAAGIYIPDVWVIEPEAFVSALEARARMRPHTDFFFNHAVMDISIQNGMYVVTTPHQTFKTAVLINAAGLYADEIANMALRKEKYQHMLLRGEYYEIVNPAKKNLVHRLVYPAVPPNYPGKGIHFSPRPDGRMLLGPNTVLVKNKNDYETNKTPASVFLDAANKFLLPDCRLIETDVTWSYSGIRPKLSVHHEDDFIISVDNTDPVLVNLIGIDSPGLSAAMEIGTYVCNLKEFYHALETKRTLQ